MPQVEDPTRKKKKGHAPAHQNKYAFKHNPKSKKTAAILASPIEHCCQRCYDKIEWRKKYRKYKPLTQPSTCNICSQRNITAAYHTVCDACSIQSEKAMALLKSWESQSDISNKEFDTQNLNPTELFNSCNISGSVQSESVDGDSSTEQQKHNQVQYRRVCTICFKSPALPSSDDECEDGDENAMRKKLRLREIKTLQRQKEREAKEKRRQRRKEQDGEEAVLEKADNDSNSSNSDSVNADDTDDDDDPFLKAVGGKDKLLTGEAFQQMLLKQQEQNRTNLLMEVP